MLSNFERYAKNASFNSVCFFYASSLDIFGIDFIPFSLLKSEDVRIRRPSRVIRLRDRRSMRVPCGTNRSRFSIDSFSRYRGRSGNVSSLGRSARFAATTIERVVVHGGSRLDVKLHPLDAKQLRTISRITVDGRLALPSGTIPSVLFSRKSLEEAGFNHITDALEQLPSATIARPNGGAPNAVAVVALRGPDPSETLVALDSQILNNTNTGDLDLTQFPISPFERSR